MLGRIRSVSASALQSGSLNPLSTEETVLSQTASSPPFNLRLLRRSNKPKAPARRQEDAPSPVLRNPFLPHDPALFVDAVTPCHKMLLNKFPVVADHALIVTQEFEPQSALLTAADHAALWQCLASFKALAFYNAGRIAGASQFHKHIQIIPTENWEVPFHELLTAGARSVQCGSMFTASQLGFVHAATPMQDVAALACEEVRDYNEAAALSMLRYTSLLASLEPYVTAADVRNLVQEEGDTSKENALDVPRPFAYNLVVTSDWMMLVPRRLEEHEGVSVNALGFVGCLLVRDEDTRDNVVDVGGLTYLRGVTFPLEANTGV